ncbi:MAG: beta-lactamase family protein [Saprospiraceae bacterium]|nr:beta-lactamase family protein [Saprospiraceae bacterium]
MKKNRLPMLALIAIVWLALMTCSKQQVPNPIVSHPEVLDSVLNHYVEEGYYPFLYARLENKAGEVLYEHSAINENLLPNTTIDGNSWIRIWSMSKIVTISLVLDLMEEGLLNLSDPVTKYIPEFANLQVAVSPQGIPLSEIAPDNPVSGCPFSLVPSDSTMTLLHLINHQAGFYYATTNIPCLDSLLAEKNLPTAKNSQELINRLAQMPLVQHPGSRDFYGTNTTVLGLVAERATGKNLQQLVKERLTDPLHIKGLQYDLPEGVTLLPRFSGKDTTIRQAYAGELDIFGPDVPDYDTQHELYLGGEGMIATADGYADFLRMLLNEGTLNGYLFLNPSTVEDIHAPHSQLDNPYGYNGYNLWVSGDSMRINQTGDVGLWIGGGYEGTHFWIDPHREFVAVIMTQMFWVQPEGYQKDDAFRGALYRSLLK